MKGLLPIMKNQPGAAVFLRDAILIYTSMDGTVNP